MYIMMSDVKNVERSRIPRASVFAGLRQEPCLHDVILATDDPNSFAMDFTSYRHQLQSADTRRLIPRCDFCRYHDHV
jgi:hypothetical protein